MSRVQFEIGGNGCQQSGRYKKRAAVATYIPTGFDHCI
jgi:hypothetical protein